MYPFLVRQATFFALLTLPDGTLRWCPCDEEADGAEEKKITELSNVYCPKMTYKKICSAMNTSSQTQIPNRSGRDRFGLTVPEQKKLCNKLESEDYPDEKYLEFIKNAK